MVFEPFWLRFLDGLINFVKKDYVFIGMYIIPLLILFLVAYKFTIRFKLIKNYRLYPNYFPKCSLGGMEILDKFLEFVGFFDMVISKIFLNFRNFISII